MILHKAPLLEKHHGNDSILVQADIHGLSAYAKGRLADCVYMDPPFMSGGNYSFVQKIGEDGWRGKRDKTITSVAYTDQWKNPQDYLEFMRNTIVACRDLMADTGCFFVHTDWRANAYVRVLLDEVFGRHNFVNEIIWAYHSGGTSKKHFARKHDTILLYKKGKNFYFNGQAVGHTRGKYRRNHTKYNEDEEGRVFYSIRSNGKLYKYYEDDIIVPNDVWTDIPHLQQKDPERTGYHTQKPLKLLERIILSTTPENGIVCDPFSGSGTTAHAALLHGRRVMACDINPTAIHLTRRRMSGTNESFEILQQVDCCTSASADIRWTQINQEYSVRLERYSVPGEEKWDTQDLLGSHVNTVDYWAAGRIHDRIFEVHTNAYRDAYHPMLSRELHILSGQGTPVVHIVDVFGNQSWFTVGSDN